jgi:hypothetical protein
MTAYPDKSRTETRTEGDDVIAVKELKLALVPSAEGEIVLPEVRLAWWDTNEGRERVAALPARVLQVLPARSGARAAARPAPARPPEPAPDPGEEPAADGGSAAPAGVVTGEPAGDARPGSAGIWLWVSAGLAAAWLATLGLWWRERRRPARPGAPSPGTSRARSGPSPSEARTRLKRACAANDASAAREALLAWAEASCPPGPPRGLEALGRALDPSAREALGELDRRLYAADASPWDGNAFWASIGPALTRACGESRGAAAEDAPLPPLYPGRA